MQAQKLSELQNCNTYVRGKASNRKVCFCIRFCIIELAEKFSCVKHCKQELKPLFMKYHHPNWHQHCARFVFHTVFLLSLYHNKRQKGWSTYPTLGMLDMYSTPFIFPFNPLPFHNVVFVTKTWRRGESASKKCNVDMNFHNYCGLSSTVPQLLLSLIGAYMTIEGKNSKKEPLKKGSWQQLSLITFLYSMLASVQTWYS